MDSGQPSPEAAVAQKQASPAESTNEGKCPQAEATGIAHQG